MIAIKPNSRQRNVKEGESQKKNNDCQLYALACTSWFLTVDFVLVFLFFFFAVSFTFVQNQSIPVQMSISMAHTLPGRQVEEL